MNVETFISESLVAITKGIRSANQAMRGKEHHPYFLLGANDWAQTVEFDIAVNASRTRGGKAGVAVLSVVEIGGEATVTQQDASRIKFSVKVQVAIT